MDFGLPQHILSGALDSCAPTPVDPSKAYKVVLSNTHLAGAFFSIQRTKPGQSLDINTLHNVYVVEELIQLIIGSNAKIIANSH